MEFQKAQYSVNKGLWGTSVGGKETLTSRNYLPEEAFPSQIKENQPSELEIEFKNGEVVAVNGENFEHPVYAIQKIEELASAYGIGRDIHVGDTIVGIKGRVGFEAAAASVIIKAHHLLKTYAFKISADDEIPIIRLVRKLASRSTFLRSCDEKYRVFPC
jgi:argininosuccinate synthase